MEVDELFTIYEESVVIVPKGQMEEENFSKEDVVYLDEDGMLEQAYDKEE